MRARHLEFLIEEPSMETFLRDILPRILPTECTFRLHSFRDPDAIPGGTWEAFERILKRAGYFPTGLRKIEAARSIAPHVDPWASRSNSFARFRDAVLEASWCRIPDRSSP